MVSIGRVVFPISAFGRVATRGQWSPCWENNLPGDLWFLWRNTHTHTHTHTYICTRVHQEGMWPWLGQHSPWPTDEHPAGHSPLWSLEDWHEPETSESAFTGTFCSLYPNHRATWPFPKWFLLLAVQPFPPSLLWQMSYSGPSHHALSEFILP